jgi:hypothetical protein
MQFTKLSVLAFSVFVLCSGGALAASEQTTTESPSGATAPGGTPTTGTKPKPPVLPLANLTFSCPNGKTFKLATGTGTGTCVVETAASGQVVGAHCRSSSGTVVAEAACVTSNCVSTSGKGSCSPVN